MKGFRVRRHERFAEWLEELGRKDRKAFVLVNARIKRVKDGNLGDHKHVDGYISELRIHYGPGYRLYYTIIDQCVVLLLCAGDKSNQARDIKLAQKLAKEAQNEKEEV